jgi:hypothetical protein
MTLEEEKDRRKSPRLFMYLPLEYRVVDHHNAYGGIVTNGSEIGLCIYTTEDIPIGTKLNVMVLFPKEYELSNFEVLTEIIWRDLLRTEEGERYQYGLKFLEIDEQDLQKLRYLIASQFSKKI